MAWGKVGNLSHPKVYVGTSAPVTTEDGLIWVNSTTRETQVYQSGAWHRYGVIPVFSDSAAMQAQIPTPQDGQFAVTTDRGMRLNVFVNGGWQLVIEHRTDAAAPFTQIGVSGGTQIASLPGGVASIGGDLKVNANLSLAEAGTHLSLGTITFRGTKGVMTVSDRPAEIELNNDIVFVKNKLQVRTVLIDDIAGHCAIPAIYKQTTTAVANVKIGSNGAMYRSTSRRKSKTGIQPFDATGIIDGLSPVSFTSTLEADDPEHRHVGFIAEDVAEVFPEAGTDGNENYDVRSLVAALVAEVKSLRRRVAVLETS